MVNLRPRRLWSTGSMPRRNSNERMPYPSFIEVDINHADLDDIDEKRKRRHHEKDLNYWKERALKLEDDLAKLEEKVKQLENVSRGGGDDDDDDNIRGRDSLPLLTKSAPPPAAATSAISSAASSNPTEMPEPSTPEKTTTDDEEDQQNLQRRKNNIVQQIVLELEWLILLHTKTDGESENDGSGIDENAHANNPREETLSGDDEHDRVKLSTCKLTKIDTSTLEELVMSALTADKDAAKPSASEATKAKTKDTHHHKKKKGEQRILYQLSCKKCIGQNFVGSCKKDNDGLKTKVKDNYAVVWQVVQTAYGKGEGDAETGDECHKHSLSFRASSLAHHLARHCQECESEEDVYQWCVGNVKVEKISKHRL